MTTLKSSARSGWGLLVLCAVPTLIYVGMLLFYPSRDLLILWPRMYDAAPLAVAALITLMALYTGLGLMWVRRVGDQPGRAAVAALSGLVVVGGLALQLALVNATNGDPLKEIARRTYAWKTGGYWTVGAPVTDVRDFVGQYAGRAPKYPVHQKRHPPGLSLIFTAGTRMFEAMPGAATSVAGWLRPDSCQSLLPVNTADATMAAGLFGAIAEVVLAMLPIWPLALLVRRLAGARAAAMAALLYALTPGFTQWVSQFDRGVALATVLVVYGIERMIVDRKRRYALFAGLTLSVATFMTFGAVPIGLIGLIYGLVRLLQTSPGYTWAARARAALSATRFVITSVLLAVLGVATVWAVMYAWAGLDPVALYTVVFDSHLSLEFSFWPFVVWHPWDLLTMVGLPVVVLSLAAWRKAPALAAAFWVPLLALSLAHVARGETGRVWLYFTPLAVGAAAVMLSGSSRVVQLAVLTLLGAHLVTQGVLIRTHEYGFWPDSLPKARIPADATGVDTRFGASGQIALLAYRLEPLERGTERQVTLYWQRMSEEPLQTAFKAFVHVARDESDQARVAQHDEMPVRELYPTTCWVKGQIVEDAHELTIPTDAPLGQFPVFVGLYDPLAEVRPPTFASPPAQQMHGSVLLPERAIVR
jgi:Dolichyl-phosphate-mannose-protein mannosyltransferase